MQLIVLTWSVARLISVNAQNKKYILQCRVLRDCQFSIDIDIINTFRHDSCGMTIEPSDISVPRGGRYEFCLWQQYYSFTCSKFDCPLQINMENNAIFKQTRPSSDIVFTRRSVSGQFPIAQKTQCKPCRKFSLEISSCQNIYLDTFSVLLFFV